MAELGHGRRPSSQDFGHSGHLRSPYYRPDGRPNHWQAEMASRRDFGNQSNPITFGIAR